MRRVRQLLRLLAPVLVLFVSILPGGIAHGVGFTVNSTGDLGDALTADGTCQTAVLGECTLRAAIEQANFLPGPDSISFSIGSGPQTIAPASPLPTISDTVTVDGTTQPGFSGSPIIELNGAGAGANGLLITASSSTVRGLVINRFGGGAGIRLESGTLNVIEGNYIGTNAAGTAPLQNAYGVLLLASGNTIGGTSAAARNVISGNSIGVYLWTDTSGNLIQGNYIGTDAAGAASVGNAFDGIEVIGTAGNTIGGIAPGAGNVISGNGGWGIRLSSGIGDVIQGNLIGTKADGVSPLGNVSHGVLIGALSTATNFTIGGAAPGAANVIAFNGESGVHVYSGAGNLISRNSFHSNIELGIDLRPEGVTSNDTGDGDSGPNNLQNFPVITSSSSGSSTAVAGTLNSTPNSTFTIELFSSPVCDPTTFGEGQTFLGTATATTDSSGNATFSASGLPPVSAGQAVAATATGPGNNTSEFSQARFVGGGPCTAPDSDGDGVPDNVDNCDNNANPDQLNADGDGWGNACDFCPNLATTWFTPTGDDDCDGFSTADETSMGTASSLACPATATANDEEMDAWPPDFSDDKQIKLQDILLLKPHFNSTPGNPKYSVRFDLNVNNNINLQDLLLMKPFFHRSCT